MSLNTDQTLKVKNAVKAKLVEIGAYVDDQLSDYVMIMITNKKTEKQMTEDLELFLGGIQQSASFSAWLHSYIKKVTSSEKETSSTSSSSTTSASHHYKKQTSSTSKYSSRKNNTSTVEETDELAIQIDSNEFNDDFNVDEKPKLKKAHTSPPRSARRADSTPTKQFKPTSNTTRETKSTPVIQNPADSKSKIEPTMPNEPQQTVLISSSVSPSTNQVKPVAHVSSKVIAVNTNKPVHKNEEEDDEDLNTNKSRLSSVIKVSDRKYNVPKSMQPSKSILLRAVDDANRSSSSTTGRVKSIADEKLALIRSKRFAAEEAENKNGREASHRTHHQNRPYSGRRSDESSNKRSKKSLSPVDTGTVASPDKRQAVLNSNSLDADFRFVSKTTSAAFLNTDRRQVQVNQKEEASHQRIAIVNEQIKDIHTNLKSNEDEDTMETVASSDQSDNLQTLNKKPMFIVTLDGLNEQEFLRKLSSNKTEYKRTLSDMEDNEEEIDDSEVLDVNENYEKMDDEEMGDSMEAEFEGADEKQLSKNKKLIRCTFWPACDKGEQCPYLHPNKPCTTFPNCQFGQLCHFLHPSCRYDGYCTRLDCTYTHLLKKPSATASAPVAATAITSNPSLSVDLNKSGELMNPASVVPEQKTNIFKSTPKITINKIQSNYYNTDQMEGGGTQSAMKTFNNSQLRRSAPNISYFKSATAAYSFAPPSQYTLVNRTTNPASVITTPCKFGTLCKNPKCIYTHPNLPQVSQLKWTAALQNSTNLSNNTPQTNQLHSSSTDTILEAKMVQS